MKFITEEDLRDLYKKQPFTDYDLKKGERLTPGARQFLVDRGVDMYDRNDPLAVLNTQKDKVKAEQAAKPGESSGCRNMKKLCGRMKALHSLFLLTARELLDTDLCLSQQLTGLSRQFAALGSVSEGKCEATGLVCNACSGMNGENFSRDIGDCFEITEFHMQMPKGREMLLLARLRSELECFSLDAEELITDEKLHQDMYARLNEIINTISQMICGAMGGKECQRKA